MISFSQDYVLRHITGMICSASLKAKNSSFIATNIWGKGISSVLDDKQSTWLRRRTCSCLSFLAFSFGLFRHFVFLGIV